MTTLPLVDPVTVEVVTSRVYTICREGMEAAKSVSASPVVHAVGDVQTGICLADGTPVSGSGWGGIHFRLPVLSTIALCEADPGIYEGDMFVTNDPWCGARHQSDIVIVAPIHYGGELIAWVGTLCHHLDVGAMSAGGWIPGATEVYQEGYRLTCLKLVDRGELRSDLYRAILNMVRSPDKVALDYKGQIAANNVVKRKVRDICAKYSKDVVLGVLEGNLERARRRLAERIRLLPDGVFSETVFVEFDNGARRDLLKVVATVSKQDDRLTLDYTGTSAQQAGPTNLAIVNLDWILTPYLHEILGTDIDFNCAFRECVEVVAPEGTIVNAIPPAPVASGGSAAWVAAAAAFNKMLLWSEDRRSRVSGGWRAGAANMVMLAGTNRRGRPFTYTVMDSSHGLGSGARVDCDGIDVGGYFNLSIVNVESHEADNPILFQYRRIAPDSGGAGRWRGGIGLEEAWTPYGTDTPLTLTLQSYGTEAPLAPGVAGGLPGALSRAWVTQDVGVPTTGCVDDTRDGAERLTAQVAGLELRPGDYVYTGAMGGGGYGDPLDRPPELVGRDVRMGCLLSETARTTYGVVVVDGEVDVLATDRERRDFRARRLAAATVRKPAAACLGESHTVLTRAGDHLELVESDAKRVIRCACGQVFCDIADNFKEYTALEETQLDEATTRLRRVPELVMRRFYCPACAAQLWVDVAEHDAPISFDVRLDSQP